MFRYFWPAVKFLFENIPNVGFYIVMFYAFRDWYFQQNILIKIFLPFVSFIAIAVVLRRTYRELKSRLQEIHIEEGLKEIKDAQRGNSVNRLIKNLPSSKELMSIYNYALTYAQTWASDGKLEDVNYYLVLESGKLRKTAQIYIQSQLKRELLAFYLPRRYQKIEEFDEYGRSSKIEIPPIYSFKNWKEAAENALESSTSDIEKSDSVNLQISPSIDSLSINFTFSKQEREWRKKYTLKGEKLSLKDKVITKFE